MAALVARRPPHVWAASCEDKASTRAEHDQLIHPKFTDELKPEAEQG